MMNMPGEACRAASVITRLVGAATAGVWLAAATPVRADGEEPANSVRAGLYTILYHTSADPIRGPFVPAGLNLEAENLETLYFAYSRRLTSHFEVELAMGYPPLAKTEGRGPVSVGSVPYNGQTISSARWIAPTLLLNYRFLDEGTPIRPYIGLGVNYTTFYDRLSTGAGNAANGGPTSLSLSASVGPAAEAGVSWRVASHFSLYASYGYSDVHSNVITDTAGILRRTHVNFGPQALVFSAGYLF